VKICTVRADLFHADGGADRLTDRHDDAISRCWQFCEPPNKQAS